MLNDPRDVVLRLVDRGAPFTEIEAFISTVPVDEDERSALWLLTWAYTTDPTPLGHVTSDEVLPPD